MFKDIISRRLRYLIQFIPSKTKGYSQSGNTFGTPTPGFPGLPDNFVGIQQEEVEGALLPKVLYSDKGIPTGRRVTSGDGIWFEAYTEKYQSLENRHFDSFESFYYFYDQI